MDAQKCLDPCLTFGGAAVVLDTGQLKRRRQRSHRSQRFFDLISQQTTQYGTIVPAQTMWMGRGPAREVEGMKFDVFVFVTATGSIAGCAIRGK